MTDIVLEHLADGITQGTYEPEVLYSAYQVADQLGISRTPVREALLRLQERGAVQFERNRGFRVKRPHSRDVYEIFEIRLTFEVPAAGIAATDLPDATRARLKEHLAGLRAAARADDEGALILHDRAVHDDILDAAGNQRVRAFISDLRKETHLLGGNTMRGNRDLEEIYQEHAPIVDAVLAGDAATAKRVMHKHLKHTQQLLLDQLPE